MLYGLCIQVKKREFATTLSGSRMRGGDSESDTYQALEASNVNHEPSRLDVLPLPLKMRSNGLANGESDIPHLSIGPSALLVMPNFHVASNGERVEGLIEGAYCSFSLMSDETPESVHPPRRESKASVCSLQEARK